VVNSRKHGRPAGAMRFGFGGALLQRSAPRWGYGKQNAAVSKIVQS